MLNLVWIVMAFFIGSVPFGLLVARVFCGGIDPRTAGSKNIGATNISRLCGFKWGVLVLLLDVLKGLIPVLVAVNMSDSAIFLSLTALAVVLGHMYSCFLGGKGGKGVATFVGAFLALSPVTTIAAIIICIAAIALSGYVSLGSLLLAVTIPAIYLVTFHWAFIPVALILGFLLFWKHKENIHRLAVGEEKSFLKSKAE